MEEAIHERLKVIWGSLCGNDDVENELSRGSISRENGNSQINHKVQIIDGISSETGNETIEGVENIEMLKGCSDLYSACSENIGGKHDCRINTQWMQRVTELILDGEDIVYISEDEVGVLEPFQNLRKVTCNGTGLRSVALFPRSLSLVVLELTDNRLRGDGLNSLVERCPNLRRLDLAGNRIQDFVALEPLNSLKNLEVLALDMNPVAAHPDYRTRIWELLPRLKVLDGCDRFGCEVHLQSDDDDEEDDDDDEAYFDGDDGDEMDQSEEVWESDEMEQIIEGEDDGDNEEVRMDQEETDKQIGECLPFGSRSRDLNNHNVTNKKRHSIHINCTATNPTNANDSMMIIED